MRTRCVFEAEVMGRVVDDVKVRSIQAKSLEANVYAILHGIVCVDRLSMRFAGRCTFVFCRFCVGHFLGKILRQFSHERLRVLRRRETPSQA